MLPYLTHKFTPETFGQYQLLVSIFELGSVALGLGLLEGLFRYAGTASNDNEQQKICTSAISTAIVIGLLIAFILYPMIPYFKSLLPGNLSAIQLQWVIVILMFENTISLQSGWLRLRNRAVSYLILILSNALLQVALTIYAVESGYGVTGIIAAIGITRFILFFAIMIMQVRETKQWLGWSHTKALLLYGWPFVFGGLSRFIFYGLGQFWLAASLGLAQMAIYSIAMKFGRLSELLLKPFNKWWGPQRYKLLKKSNGLKANAKIVAMGTTFSIIIALAVGLGSSIIIQIITPSAYHNAQIYVPWLAMLMSLKVASNLYNLGNYLKKTPYLQNIINTGSSILGIIAFCFLIPRFGISGAIASLYIAITFRFTLSFIFSQRALYIPYPFKKLMIIASISILFLTLGNLIEHLGLRLIMTFTFVTTSVFIALKMSLIPYPRQLIHFRNQPTVEQS